MDQALLQQTPPIILIVDDEDYVADMIATYLQLDNYQVHTAYNGRHGIEIADHLAQIDLIIVDVMMPYLNGIEFIRQIRTIKERATLIPAIMISAGARPIELPSNTIYLPKPFDMDLLLQYVTERVGSMP